MLGAGVGDANIVCADNELLSFSAPSGQTCGQYMQNYIGTYGGYLSDSSTSSCTFCSASSTNAFLASFDILPSQKWRNFGIMWAYIGVNVILALGIYWLARVVSLRPCIRLKGVANATTAEEPESTGNPHQ